jgi:hypothetical protein
MKRNTNNGAETMNAATYHVVRIEDDGRENSWTTADLAEAVAYCKALREDGEGQPVELRNADGSRVTRGQVRAAGIKC